MTTNRIRSRSRNIFLCLTLGAMAFTGPILAVAKDEMVVTSRKRAENLMDVPLAITAFDAQDIEEARIANLDDVANLTPGLNFFNPIGEFLPVPVIRGIAPTDIFGEPNAALFIDGVYVAGREGLNFSQLDIERIEVNKGPQAALYGRNAFSGSINFVTARPEEEFGTKADVTVGSEAHFKGTASVTGPLLGDVLRGRASLGYDTWDGSYDNSLSSRDVGGHDKKTFIGSIDYVPSDSLMLSGFVYFSEDEIDANPTTSLPANCEDSNFADNPPNPPRLENFCGEIPELDGEDIPKIAGATGEERRLRRAHFDIDWNVGFGTLTSLTAYSETEQSSATDGNRNLGEDLPFVYCNLPVNFPFPGTCTGAARFTTGLLQVSPGPDVSDEFSQEFRFSSEVGRITYDLGAYYFNLDQIERDIGVIATQPIPADSVGLGPFVTIIPGVSNLPIGGGAFGPWFQPGGDVGDGLTLDRETESYSVFGALDFEITENLSARVEARYADEEKTEFVAAGNPDGSDVNLEQDWNLFSWRVGTDYTLPNDMLVYASISQAEKPGKFDTQEADVIVGIDPMTGDNIVEERLISVVVDPEKLTALEIGLKGRIVDDRVRFDIAAYYNDWENIVIPQVFGADPATGLAFEQPEALDRNAGSADVLGVELQTDIQITEHWDVTLGGSWTDSELKDARLESFADWPSFAPLGDVSGNQLLRQPEWMANGVVRYARPLAAGWEVLARADANYQSKVYNGNDNQSWYPSRTIVNGLLSFTRDNVTIAFWGQNIFNEKAPTGGFRDVFFNNTSDVTQSLPASSVPAADFFPFRYTVTHPRLRTVGATFRLKFGSLL